MSMDVLWCHPQDERFNFKLNCEHLPLNSDKHWCVGREKCLAQFTNQCVVLGGDQLENSITAHDTRRSSGDVGGAGVYVEDIWTFFSPRSLLKMETNFLLRDR